MAQEGPDNNQVEEIQELDDSDSTDRETHAKTWFDHMTGYLKWKIIGPDIANPFKTPLPYHTLHRMANQRDYLNQYIQVRCMCDGYEVMMITNPASPRISTEHPTISRMKRNEIAAYIRRAGLADEFETEIDRIQEEVREYLKLRERTIDSESAKTQKKGAKDGAKKNKRDPKDDSAMRVPRIIRR